jgi:hypothetical protein
MKPCLMFISVGIHITTVCLKESHTLFTTILNVDIGHNIWAFFLFKITIVVSIYYGLLECDAV